MLKKSMLIGIFLISLLFNNSAQAQIVNASNNQEFLNFLANYNFASTSTETSNMISNATSTSEDIIYNKKAITNISNPVTVIKPTLEKKVYLDDILGVNITSRYDPSSPIEIFILTYKNDITKKIFIKFVYNEVSNVLKTYRLTMNQDLLDEIGNVDYFKVGFCVNGCKMIPIKMIVTE